MLARCVRSAALALAPSALCAAQGSVLVVDWVGGPGSQYTAIQPAVDAAVNGDVILVRPGSYQPFVLDAKDLVIEGDVGTALPSIQFGATVRNVSGAAVLRNLEFPNDTLSYKSLVIESCGGSVLVDGCVLQGGDPALRVTNSAAVTIAASQLEGHDWIPSDLFALGGRNAILGQSSSIYAYDSLLAGGDGRDTSFPVGPTSGGDGVLLHGGVFLAEACVVSGGAGGDGGLLMFGACAAGAKGGTALVLADGAPTAYTTGCSLSAGPGGAGASVCFPGSSGDTISVASGTHVPLGGIPRVMDVTSPVREGGSIVFEFVDMSGTPILLLVSPQAAPALALAFLGSLLPSTSGSVVSLGFISHPSGFKQVTVTAGQLAPGVQALGLYLQPAFVHLTPGPTVFVGPPRHVLLLDQSF